MAPFIVTMIIVLAVAVAACAVVAIGMHGVLKRTTPKLAGYLEVAGRHLNGDAEMPESLAHLLPSK